MATSHSNLLVFWSITGLGIPIANVTLAMSSAPRSSEFRAVNQPIYSRSRKTPSNKRTRVKYRHRFDDW